MPVYEAVVEWSTTRYSGGRTVLVKIVPVPSAPLYSEAARRLAAAKSSGQVPQLIRVRLEYERRILDYEPSKGYPRYTCPLDVTVYTVDWEGNEYVAVFDSMQICNKYTMHIRGVVDLTDKYRLPLLMLTPWKIVLDVGAEWMDIELKIKLYVEWGW